MPPLNNDIVPPFDVTAYTTLSASDLQQLVSGLSPANDKGMIVVTFDVNNVAVVPDATTTVKWQNYLWLRVMSTMSVVYVWNVNAINADNNLKNWLPITSSGIGFQTITTDMIKDGSITDIKIHDVSYSKLTGTPPELLDNSVTYAKLALNAVKDVKIADNGITPNKLKTGGITGQVLRIDSTGLAFEYFTPTTSNLPIITPSAYNKLLGVSTIGQYEFVDKLSIGSVLQNVFIDDGSIDDNSSGGGALTPAGGIGNITIAMGKNIPGLTVNFLPKAVGSKIVVDLQVNLGLVSSEGNRSAIALFVNDASAAVACAVSYSFGASTSDPNVVPVRLRYSFITAAPLAAIKFAVRYIYTINDASHRTSYNSEDAATVLFGGTLKSSISVIELAQ